MRFRLILILMVLIVMFVNGACEKRSSSDRDVILKKLRNEKFLLSCYKTKKSLFEIGFAEQKMPGFNEYLNRSLIYISNEVAVVTCFVSAESQKSDRGLMLRYSGHVIILRRAGKKWEIIEYSSPTGFSGSVSPYIAYSDTGNEMRKRFYDRIEETFNPRLRWDEFHGVGIYSTNTVSEGAEFEVLR